jgi:hypothetical protein
MKRSMRRKYLAWIVAVILSGVALYPAVRMRQTNRSVSRRLQRLEAQLGQESDHLAPLGPGRWPALGVLGPGRWPALGVLGPGRWPPLDAALSLRVQQLGPLLASWETVGGCGAGSTGGAGSVKWIGRSTTGGLFQDVTQFNYIHLDSGANYVLSTQVTRDLGEQWVVGVFVPFVYKRYNNYMNLDPPTDISNAGLGDINLLGTFRFGPINATSLTLSLGLPTGTHDATYRMDPLTQEKQLGLGRVTGTLTLDHTIDETWGVVVLGGLASYRGGENELGNYRAPFASVYGYAGYFLGPLVPALGVSLSGFLNPDRDRGMDQDVPLVLVAPNASIEWSTDWLAVLLGISLPIGLYGKKSMVGGIQQGPSITGLQPWTLALGVSVSPF